MTDEELRLECLKMASLAKTELGILGTNEIKTEYIPYRTEVLANRFFKYVKEGHIEDASENR